MEKQFWGKVIVESAFGFFYFEKKGKVQRLLHRLKYKKHPEIGEKLGALYAAELMASKKIDSIDCIIAIPLHRKKMKIRGYNQALCFANGIADIIQKPVLKKSLYRVKNTATQTKKSRFERYKNVSMVFKIRHPNDFINKHILLVDDVMTTGSTLAACIRLFNKIEGCKVSVATIAYAE
ncbi:MAG: ComF family protein [Bacteroidota bacterium]